MGALLVVNRLWPRGGISENEVGLLHHIKGVDPLFPLSDNFKHMSDLSDWSNSKPILGDHSMVC